MIFLAVVNRPYTGLLQSTLKVVIFFSCCEQTGHGFASVDSESSDFSSCYEQTGHGFASIDSESSDFSSCCEQTGHGFALIDAENSDFFYL